MRPTRPQIERIITQFLLSGNRKISAPHVKTEEPARGSSVAIYPFFDEAAPRPANFSTSTHAATTASISGSVQPKGMSTPISTR